MRRKKLLAVAAALCALLLLAACSGTSAKGEAALDPKNPVTVTLWHYYVGENQQALEAAVSGFNQSIGIQEGVVVEPVAMGSIAELETAVTDSAKGVINAKEMPQIFSSYPDKAMEIDQLGMVVDLNEYFTQEEKDLYVEDFLRDGAFDEGRLLLLPIVKSTELLYVNNTGWQEFAGEEGFTDADLATWEDIYEAARAYYHWADAQTGDVQWDGRGLIGFDSVANYIIIGCKQLGVDVIDAASGENGAALLDEAALRRVFEPYVKGMGFGYFNAVGKFRSDDIKAGDLVAYVGSSSSAAYFPTWIEKDGAQQGIDFLPLQYPVFSGGEAYAIQQGAGMCVAKSTPRQQAGAVLFLKWFTESAQNIEFAMTTGYLPVQQAAYSAPEFDQVLEELRIGSEDQQNVAGVYDIALQQITQASTYAAKPFPGSYDVRSVLQAALIASGEESRAAVDKMKVQGLSEEEMLGQLDVDARFEAFIAAVEADLDEAGIAHQKK